MSEDPLSLYRFRTLADAKTETPSYSWEDRWLYNAAGVVSGRGGAGKTTYVLDKLALATVGRLPGRYFGTPSKVAMLGTLEDGESPAKLRIQAAAGDPELVLIPEFPDFETGQPEPFTMAHLDTLRQFLGDLHVRIAAIDQFNLLIRDPNKGADVARVLPPLNQVAQNVGCTIVGINHFRKSGGIGGDLVAGSIMIRNYSRFLILMADQGEDEPRVCTLDKLNLSRMQGSSWQFTLESAQVPTDDGGVADMAIVRELGDTDASVQDVVNRMYADAQNTNSDQDENEAQAFILDYLAEHGGEAVAGEVIKAGRAAGFNEGELKDARRRCKNPKIKSRKSGKPWVWAIEHGDESEDEGGKGGKGGRSENLATLPPSLPSSEETQQSCAPATGREPIAQEMPTFISRPGWTDTTEGCCPTCGGDTWTSLAPSEECAAFHLTMVNPAAEADIAAVASRLHTNSVNGSNGTNGSNGRYPNSSEGSQSNRSNRSKCSDRSNESDDPADPCPNCGYSLTLRAGTQKCAWQHKQAQATAKEESAS